MENVASTEAATIKKKRNRSHKKSKSKVTVAEQLEQATTVERAGVGEKENNPPSTASRNPIGKDQRHKEDNTSTGKKEETVAGQLTRNPSRRRKRKPKSGKESKDNATLLESLTIDEVFPVSLESRCNNLPVQPNLHPVKASLKQTHLPDVKKVPFDGAKYVGVIDIDYRQVFPATGSPIKDIPFDEIFPGPDVFSLPSSKIAFGKLTVPSVGAIGTIVTQKVIGSEPLRPHLELQDISSLDVFPTNPSVGLKLCTEQVLCPTDFDSPAQSLDNSWTMSSTTGGDAKPDKTREEILAERQAKKAAKTAAKTKSKDKPAPSAAPAQRDTARAVKLTEAKSPAKLTKSGTDASICEKMKELHISDDSIRKPSSQAAPTIAGGAKELSKAERRAQFEAQNPALAKKDTGGAKPTLTKAERRAIQEAQRAAKAEAQMAKQNESKTTKDGGKKPTATGTDKPAATETNKSVKKTGVPLGVPRKHIVTLFNHLHQSKFLVAEIVNSPTLHPAVTKLGIQYAEGAVVGSKARCLALLKMLNQLIHDYETPPAKEFGRSFEETINTSSAYLHRCRPFSVSMTNALRHVKMHIRQLDGKVSVSEQKEYLLESIESYIRDQIEKAEEAICMSVQEKIVDGDVILTYGCSSLIKHILEEANRRSKNFRVVIVNARPREEEHGMLEQLVQQGVKCTCVLINAISYVMPDVTKVLLGAHALLANGSVMSRVGTAQIALVAKSYNVPVLVCCETHKFTERVQTDAFVYNEIGNPNDLVLPPRAHDHTDAKPMLADWETLTSLTILNLHYDVTPPELVTAVVTEVAILPCTSVPVILRIKPSDVTY